MKRDRKIILSIALAAVILLMGSVCAAAASYETQISSLYFKCDGQTIKTAYDVPLSNFSDSGNGVIYGYVNLAAAFGDGAEEWYAVNISNSVVDSGSIGKYLNDATRVFYFVTLRSYDPISRTATVDLYPKGIMPGSNTVQVFDAKTNAPRALSDGNNETALSWDLRSIKDGRVSVAECLGEAANGGVEKVELWYGGVCRYSFHDKNIPAEWLYENGERALIKAYVKEAYKLKSVSSNGMDNEWYIYINGKPWSYTSGINPFGVEYIPVGEEINLLDYFSGSVRSVLSGIMEGYDKNSVYYEPHVELYDFYSQTGFTIDTDKIVEWMEEKGNPMMSITFCSQMSEELFYQRYSITGESFPYTGKPIGVGYKTSHPSYRAAIKYDTEDGAAPVNAGTYKYTMYPTNTAFLPYEREGVLTIAKAVPEDGIPFATQRVLFDGKVKNIDADYLGLSDAPKTYKNVSTGETTENPTKIGIYDVCIEIRDNSNIEDGTLTLSKALQICESLTEHSIQMTGGSANFSKEIKGEKITITANDPAAGKVFDHWESSVKDVKFANSKASKTSFLMPGADVKIKAVYRDIIYSVTVEGGSAENGSGAAGAELAITADEIEGKIFTGWSVVSGGASIKDPTQKSTTVTLKYSDTVVRASFTDDEALSVKHSIMISHGTASPRSAKAGEIVTISYDGSSSSRGGMVFESWVCNRGGVVFENANAQTTTFIMPNEDVTITAREGIRPPRPRFASIFGDSSAAAIAVMAGVVLAASGAAVYFKKKKKDKE